MKIPSLLALAIALSLSACSKTEEDNDMSSQQAANDVTSDNPFFVASDLPYQMPPFDRIDDAHFVPAFERGMAEQLAEIEAITTQTESPTFENTMIPLEQSGQLLSRVAAVFFNLTSTDTNDTLDAIDIEMAPKLSAHSDRIYLDPDLFARINWLYEQRDTLGLDSESTRLIEETWRRFVRAGAMLSEEAKTRVQEINAELATLQNQFSQNVLKEVNASAVVVDTAEELAGLSDGEIAAAAEAAKARGMEGKYVIALLNTSGQPALASLENRALRERIMKASLARGSSGGEFDNRDELTRVAKLRAERAQLFGMANHAEYSLQNQTARTTAAVNQRLASLTKPAVANAEREATDLQAMIDAEGGDFKLAAWDWAYYAEKVRQARYDFDESQLKPYLELNNVLENGVFFAATKLYGITFKERTDLPVYNPTVRVWEVFNADGTPLALFFGDFYARSSKRGGAWMNEYVSQSGLMGTHAVVGNHLNIPKPPEGEPTLMTWDEVTTMFHEFGHALHGMFSDVRYPSFSGTNVPRDFVEYPSQVNEMWASWPEVLKNYAVHYQTGEPMPTELLDKVLATQKFNQGFATVEYLAAALLDQSWHQLPPEGVPAADGLLAFEQQSLAKAGVLMAEVPPRYRSTYFSHIVGGYSAGYYSYIWSEVLDADSVEWFKENGGLKRENGDHFRKMLLSRGGSADAMSLFRDFRGADPNVEPLLERRGLN